MEGGAEAEPGLSVIVPVTAAAWLTEKVNGFPPAGVIVIVADCAVLLVLAAASHVTVAEPLPDVLDVTVSQGWLLTMLHSKAESEVVSVNEPGV